MSDCIFCKISRGEIDSNFLYEDDDCVVFRDINPKAATHLLIVPKKHLDSVAHISCHEDACLVGHLIHVAKKIADELRLKGYKLQINVGRDGGQEIFHIHIHLMSKFATQ